MIWMLIAQAVNMSRDGHNNESVLAAARGYIRVISGRPNGRNEEHQSHDLVPPALEWQCLLEIRTIINAPAVIKSATPHWIVLNLRYPSRTANAMFVATQATSRESAPTRTKPDVHLPDRRL